MPPRLEREGAVTVEAVTEEAAMAGVVTEEAVTEGVVTEEEMVAGKVVVHHRQCCNSLQNRR